MQKLCTNSTVPSVWVGVGVGEVRLGCDSRRVLPFHHLILASHDLVATYQKGNEEMYYPWTPLEAYIS